MTRRKYLLIIPCKNEVSRVDLRKFVDFKDLPVDVLFIDDGSYDETYEVLIRNYGNMPNYKVLKNKKNVGKSKTIQRGFRFGIENMYEGFITLDADMAYAYEDLKLILSRASDTRFNLIIHSRVNLYGWNVQRSKYRSWASRIVSTYLFFLLSHTIYDIQSPLKFYRNNNKLLTLMQDDIKTRWFFDAELFLRDKDQYYKNAIEYPILMWSDTSSNNFRFNGILLTFKDLLILLMIKL